MKNKKVFLVGVFSLALAFTMAITSCDNDSPNSGYDSLSAPIGLRVTSHSGASV
jgi:hypothetical protein